MFYALDESGNKILPKPNIKGFCPCCKGEVIAKCGGIKLHHWSHKTLTQCDQWYEMTAWHLGWQSLFPVECREVVIQKDDVSHRADIKINNLIIEFQHSTLSKAEIEERELFYGSDANKLIWVIDATNNRLYDKWKEQLITEEVKPILIVDQDSNIYFKLVGYSSISISRKLSLPIGLVVSPKFPVFLDTGEYIACPLEKSAYEISHTTYYCKWGHQQGSYNDFFILVNKEDFVRLLPSLPTNLSKFESIKFCDEYTLSKREERIKDAKSREEKIAIKRKYFEERARRKEEKLLAENKRYLE
ncbi:MULTISPECIES: competence protein CoiA [Nostoc]|uniref:Competence protein CoiA-like family protein n=1 Tax=Nostoc paludosum FACHB-159 TaxID=2692908 RepID=A0ABR8KEP6_9NOSO|nr:MULTISPECIES: competence protein CoiA family protein [Nostoc]MBD2681575.1 hypothetical protein [Nostoc sp. FACHB-857]MBD2738036.1 hypothetical protein [Nostoc paludosum FACHB-159]